MRPCAPCKANFEATHPAPAVHPAHDTNPTCILNCEEVGCSQTMKSAYFDTLFESARVPAPSAFAILTAHNPNGEPSDRASNEAADRRLAALLREQGMEPWRVVGYAPDRSHAETGWGAEISLEDACRLGREFEQDAIYWVDNDRLELIGLKTPGRETLGSWQSRVQPFALPYFTLYLGSCPPQHRFDPADEARVRDSVLAFFQNFTIQSARGCFLGGWRRFC